MTHGPWIHATLNEQHQKKKEPRITKLIWVLLVRLQVFLHVFILVITLSVYQFFYSKNQGPSILKPLASKFLDLDPIDHGSIRRSRSPGSRR